MFPDGLYWNKSGDTKGLFHDYETTERLFKHRSNILKITVSVHFDMRFDGVTFSLFTDNFKI